MAIVTTAAPTLSGELSLFHTTDPLLANSPVLIFHGPAASIGPASSRIQVHVFTPAGHASYARLQVAPTSPLYTAVANLPREEQGDEVCRGLAFGLKRYFVELPEAVKSAWCAKVKAPSPAALFGDDHIAILATRMTRIENVDEVIETIAEAYSEQRLSWQDVDVVLPPGSIKQPLMRDDSTEYNDQCETDHLHHRCGRYAELIASLGDTAFLPTSRLKRAPSKPLNFGRTASFLKHQKESARKELCELLETEASYVERVHELQQIAECLGANLDSIAQRKLRKVFPSTISSILDLNSRFLVALRQIVDSTEQSALQDVASLPDGQPPTAQQARDDFMSDTQGLVALSSCLCDWFPQFADFYGLYLKAHADAAQALRTLFRSSDPTLVAALQEAGEQRLTSLLIEPVQRLPRYNLYIDSILKQLPIRHPATKHLLKARDIITETCSQDDNATGPEQVLAKLRQRVAALPANLQTLGRLLTIVDFAELPPPYSVNCRTTQQGLLLLFTDSVLLLEKTAKSAISARSLLVELESVLPTSTPDQFPAAQQDLLFSRRVQLDCLHCTESHGGRVLQLFATFSLEEGAKPPPESATHACQVLKLEANYDGKAARLVEEIAKAKVEARFSEAERESVTWEVRASDAAADHASLLSAVFEDVNLEYANARHGSAPTRLLIDIDKHSQRPRAGQNGIRTVVAVSPLQDGLWRLTIDSVDGVAVRENVRGVDFAAVLSKRLVAFQAAQFAIDKGAFTVCLLGKNADILSSIELQATPNEQVNGAASAISLEKTPRPRSPRKLLSSFLSSTGSGSVTAPAVLLKKDLPALPPPPRPQSMFQPTVPKPPSRESRPSSQDQHSTPRSISFLQTYDRPSDPACNPHHKLEATLSTYLLALQARKGNIVGRSLKLRASAPPLAVNDLYNSLLEDPNLMVLAAQAPVDVLFAAFEKFLHVAWREQVGPLIDEDVLRDIQAKAETLFPADFDVYFRTTMRKLAPQNERAFGKIIKLLADLLDGTGNDGDRGILTAAFAELLVTEGDPHHYIALIDRFVDDTDTYFGEPNEQTHTSNDPAASATAVASDSAHKRSRSVNSASLTSNTSSLRRKFGFLPQPASILKENHQKTDPPVPAVESKVAAVWRSLSKSTRGTADAGSPGGSLSKATPMLLRAQSTEAVSRRPKSQDGGSAMTAATADEVVFGQQTAGATPTLLALETIGEHPSFIPTGAPPRKKRRSSLSDLKAMTAAARQPPQSPSQSQQPPKSALWSSSPSPRRPPLSDTKTPSEDKSLPASPMPSTPSSKGGSGRFGSPARGTPRSRLPASFRTAQENSPAAAVSGVTGNKQAWSERPRSSGNITNKAEEVVITAHSARNLTSGIPLLAPRMISGPPKAVVSPQPSTTLTPAPAQNARIGLSERPGAGNMVPKRLSSPSTRSAESKKLTKNQAEKVFTASSDPPAAAVMPLAAASPRKLRMQSPAKLRERLQNEQSAIAAARDALQDDLKSIGDELSGSAAPGARTPGSIHGATAMQTAPATGAGLAQRISAFETRLLTEMEAQDARIRALQAELASSLVVCESKCRKLDELYREANGENEALYARFNEELGRVLKGVRAGEGVEELRRKLREGEEEKEGLRRERGRLRREVVGLRAQLKG